MRVGRVVSSIDSRGEVWYCDDRQFQTVDAGSDVLLTDSIRCEKLCRIYAEGLKWQSIDVRWCIAG